MAGAGYKLFNTGDVLTAAQVNTYLQEQTVMVFASSAARTSALSGVLAEGMVSYLQDSNVVEVYNGSAWVGVSGAGDVTEVQAGTGISVASGTGPIPVVTNTMATAIDAKGDLVVGTGADTFSRLAVGGTNGHSLQVDSSTATGLKWAAPAGGGGKVLQVVSATYSTETTTASTTYADTGLTASITPSSATSKVMILVSQSLAIETSSAAGDVGGAIRLMRDSTGIFNNAAEYQTAYFTSATFTGTYFIVGYTNIMYLDSPATTSALTYKTQGRSYDTANGEKIKTQVSSATSTITLLEIGA
jgi:hypothetical protein